MNPPAGPLYEVRVEGVLGGDWSAWFDGLELTADGDQTVLAGHLEDQAALHGVLYKIRDLGLQLVSVRRLDPEMRHCEGDPP